MTSRAEEKKRDRLKAKAHLRKREARLLNRRIRGHEDLLLNYIISMGRCKNAIKMAAVSQVAAERFLPHEIIAGILSRLPVKSIVMLRLVCKLWCSLTHDPHFIIEHHQRAHGRLTLINRILTSETISLFNFGADGEVHECSFIFNPGKKVRYQLSSHVNGLVCGYRTSKSEGYDYLLNPFTRECLELPHSTMAFDKDFCHQIGLGYVASTGEYKLIRLCHHCKPTSVTKSWEVLTLGTSEWRYGGEFSFVVDNKQSVYLHGAVHWMARVSPASCYPSGKIDLLGINYIKEETCGILAFDFKDEKFQFMPAPNIIPGFHWMSNLFLQMLEGHICLVKTLDGTGRTALPLPPRILEIWMLTDYAQNKWRRKYRVDMACWVNETKFYGVYIVEIKGGRVLMQTNKSLYAYNIQKRIVQLTPPLR